MTIPDTTEAVNDVLKSWTTAPSYADLAKAAIAAHNAELARVGAEMLMPGEMPSWMETVPWCDNCHYRNALKLKGEDS